MRLTRYIVPVAKICSACAEVNRYSANCRLFCERSSNSRLARCDPSASTKAEILTMILYVTIGGMASILGSLRFMLSSVLLLAVGYILVLIADARAAKSGDAPAHFAILRPRQMSIAVISLLAICVNLIER